MLGISRATFYAFVRDEGEGLKAVAPALQKRSQ